MLRKTAGAAALLLAATVSFAEQLTRFAVVDLTKVMQSFYKESKAMRDYEDRKRTLKVEVDKMQEEIRALLAKKVEAEAKGDALEADKINQTIEKRKELVKEYYQVKTDELEAQRQKLMATDQLYPEVYEEIQRVAESEGYTMVLDWKRGSELSLVLWSSTTIDITDKVIANLLAKKR